MEEESDIGKWIELGDCRYLVLEEFATQTERCFIFSFEEHLELDKESELAERARRSKRSTKKRSLFPSHLRTDLAWQESGWGVAPGEIKDIAALFDEFQRVAQRDYDPEEVRQRLEKARADLEKLMRNERLRFRFGTWLGFEGNHHDNEIHVTLERVDASH